MRRHPNNYIIIPIAWIRIYFLILDTDVFPLLFKSNVKLSKFSCLFFLPKPVLFRGTDLFLQRGDF